jgi:hypothetical protein
VDSGKHFVSLCGLCLFIERNRFNNCVTFSHYLHEYYIKKSSQQSLLITCRSYFNNIYPGMALLKMWFITIFYTDEMFTQISSCSTAIET